MFYAVGSVNPYRSDAIETLQHLSELGVTIIKWLVRLKIIVKLLMFNLAKFNGY